MRIRLKKDWKDLKAGDVVNVRREAARLLIQQGIAEQDKVIPELERK